MASKRLMCWVPFWLWKLINYNFKLNYLITSTLWLNLIQFLNLYVPWSLWDSLNAFKTPKKHFKINFWVIWAVKTRHLMSILRYRKQRVQTNKKHVKFLYTTALSIFDGFKGPNFRNSTYTFSPNFATIWWWFFKHFYN